MEWCISFNLETAISGLVADGLICKTAASIVCRPVVEIACFGKRDEDVPALAQFGGDENASFT
tara:strand:+ start:272 stop:460 length:189 start_codon:yes stop_codon:yes gene_type:complete